jgi:hypothetical protein
MTVCGLMAAGPLLAPCNRVRQQDYPHERQLENEQTTTNFYQLKPDTGGETLSLLDSPFAFGSPAKLHSFFPSDPSDQQLLPFEVKLN